MNNQTWMLLAGMLLLGACASVEDPTTMAGCQDRTINFNLNRKKPRVSPPNVCASPGSSLLVKITPATRPKGSVFMIAKIGNPDGGGMNNWLSATNALDAREIQIDVPDLPTILMYCSEAEVRAEKCQFRYSVGATGNDTIDPRVTIKR